MLRDCLAIETDEIVVEVAPALGGGVAAFDWKRGQERIPVFRRWDGLERDPSRLACFVLIPWSNRVSGRSIALANRVIPLPITDPRDRYPIHGEGWLKPWRVVSRSPAELVLTFTGRAIPGFDYEAMLTYAVLGSTLRIELSVLHLGSEEAPYGLGLHPWFHRSAKTLLLAPAAAVWLEGPDHLPAGNQPAPIEPEWDFSSPTPLPHDWINNCFIGWKGTARIEWPDRDLVLDLNAGPGLGYYILYSPERSADFFCFEPVSHAVDASHLPGGAVANGLRILKPGGGFAIAAEFKVSGGCYAQSCQ